MRNKDMLYFIGHSLVADKIDGRKEEIIRRVQLVEFDWNLFVFLASNHRVLQLIYTVWKSTDLLKLMPEELVEHLEEVYKLNEKRNYQIEEQIKEINATLNRANIMPVYLKGAANLIDNLYKNRGDRLLVDIDLLVSQNDISDTISLLKANGYANYKGKKLVASPKHYPRLTKDNTVADVEVHFLAVSPQYSEDFNYCTISQNWKNINSYPFCFVLSDEDKLKLNFIHAHLNNGGSKTCSLSLRDLYDVIMIGDRIDMAATIKNIAYTKEADSYFYMIKSIFGLPSSYFKSSYFCTDIYKFKHDIFLDHPSLFRVNRFFCSRKSFFPFC